MLFSKLEKETPIQRELPLTCKTIEIGDGRSAFHQSQPFWMMTKSACRQDLIHWHSFWGACAIICNN